MFFTHSIRCEITCKLIENIASGYRHKKHIHQYNVILIVLQKN